MKYIEEDLGRPFVEGCFVADWVQTIDIGSSRSHYLFDIGKTDILDCAIASTVDNQAEIVTYTHEDMESFQDAEKCCNEIEAFVFRVTNEEAPFVIGAVICCSKRIWTRPTR